MSQTITYWVEDDGESAISEEEWADIDALQKRTNLRQYFHKGQLGFLRFTYEPRWPQLFADSALPESLSVTEMERHVEMLVDRGWRWEDLVRAKLAARVPGGLYGSECLLAGQSEVSDLRSDLRLVIRFLLKASVMAPRCVFHAAIDGPVRVPELLIQNGEVRHDPKAMADRLEDFRRRDDVDSAVDLLDAVDSGDYLSAPRGDAPTEG
ncbi:MAG: hypothetical protein M0000_01630 [Actinomycetota bacterium]|nr:hypothetical protein [Actinomycetota bacterium]